MRTIVAALFFVLVLNGCFSGKKPVTQTKEFPSWYSDSQTNSSNALYAVAEGENKRIAINNALNEILATLSVSISSDFTSKTEVSKGDRKSYQVTSSNTIQSRVKEIKINNYQVINEKDFGFERYLVEVKVQKKKLFLGLQQELDSTFIGMQKRAKSSNAIEQLAVYQKDKNSIENIKNILSVMHALETGFNDTYYREEIVKIHNRYTKLLSQVSFSLYPNKDAKNLQASFFKGLSDAKYHIRDAEGRKHFTIYIESTTNKAESYGFSIARTAISVQVKDYKGTVIGSNKFNLIGQSTQGYAIAKENVAMKLNTMIQRQGIAEVIGLNL